MNTKSDWQLVNQELMAEQRRKLGDPPSAEEMLAYTRGELTEEQEDRIRAFLVCYPELARAVATDVTDDEPNIADADVMRRFIALQKELRAKETRREAGRVVPFRQLPAALAAILALVFAGLYWNAETRARRLSNARQQPHGVIAMQEIRPGGQRGAGGVETLSDGTADHLLRLVIGNAMHYDQYRVEISAAESRTPLWGETGVQRMENDEFLIFVPRKFLTPGRYDIALYGLAGENRQLLESYSVQVP
jgi:hypothetical protein